MNVADPVQVKQDIEMYKSSVKLPSFEPSMDIEAMLAILSGGELSKLDSTTLNEYAVRLACYAAYITSEINRQNTAIDWAMSNIRNLLGQHIRDMTDYSYQEKFARFVSVNEDAARLEKIRITAEYKKNTLVSLDQRIHFISQMVQNLARERSWAKRNNYGSH